LVEDVSECDGPSGLESIYRRKIIATGTLILSVGVVSNAVLVKDIWRTWNDAIEPPQPIYVERFHWFAAGNALEPVATFTPGDDMNNLHVWMLEPVLSVADPENHDFTLYPNPTNERITLQSRDGGALGIVRILSAEGRTVRELGMQMTDRAQLDVQGLSPGLYTVIASTRNASSHMRFVKQ
ncbi:MAG TPA: T9SS type A sorting domain-containing protein, partial [Flavobacteriales bacterium]|nr:T9SS type A sorting domain-containing protein [Flavobacteriales bacterium]